MKLKHLTTLLYLFGFWWLFFAVAWFLRDSEYRYFYSLFGLAYAFATFVLALFIGRKKLWAWWGAVAFVGASILISAFDQIGWADLLFIAGATGVFIVFLKGRSLMVAPKKYGKSK